jgi:hypothetical protein
MRRFPNQQHALVPDLDRIGTSDTHSDLEATYFCVLVVRNATTVPRAAATTSGTR